MPKASRVTSRPPQGKKQKPVRLDKRLLLNHHKAGLDAFKQLLQNPLSSIITCLVMAMTILVTTTLFVTLKSFRQVTNYIHSTSPITIYLKSGAREDEINSWVKSLNQEPLIKNITYISPDSALKELADNMDDKNILTEIQENPLPPVLLIKLSSTKEMSIQALVAQLKSSPLVSTIRMDDEWLKRLSVLIKLGNRMSYALTILFGIGVIFIITHTIQGATQRNHQEMEILLLMGANKAYIRRPFLYLGALLGTGAGIIALILLMILFLPLKQPLKEIMDTYQLTEDSWLFSSGMMIRIFITSTLLGWLGAWLAFYRYAKLNHLSYSH
jgi:cell division transport system permease protein